MQPVTALAKTRAFQRRVLPDATSAARAYRHTEYWRMGEGAAREQRA